MTWLRPVRRAANSARAGRVRAAFACVALAAASIAGCTSGATAAPTAAPAPTDALKFDVDGVLAVAPGQVLDVTILVPEGHDRISVWLEGDYLDGSISQADLDVRDGRAKVTLHAPATPSTFAMGAKAAGLADARLDVSVSASGFGTVRASATYRGHRASPEMVASVYLQSTCAAIEGATTTTQHDGAPRNAAAPGVPLILTKVPAGARLAVAVRIGHYATGCVDLDPLVPNATRDVALDVIDRPMALDRTNLQALLTFEPAPADRVAWDAMLTAAEQKAATAFVPSSTTEPARLLDTMATLVPTTSSAAFTTARTNGNYESAVTTWLGQHTPSLKSRASSYLQAARSDAFGDLALHIDPSGQPGLATVTLSTYAHLPAANAGLSVPAAFGWTADPDDTVHLSGSVDVSPTKLVTRAADGRAAVAVSGATTVADALASQVDCAGLGATLVSSAPPYPSCDATCAAALCRSALASMWSDASDASAQSMELAQIGLAASAHADVGDDASPIAFAGTWVGQVTAPGATFALKGTASASVGSLVK